MPQFDAAPAPSRVSDLATVLAAPSSHDEARPAADVAGPRATAVARLGERLAPLRAFPRLARRDAYAIGEIAAHLKVSLRTLRFYEQSGLLRPTRVGLKRLYAREDVERLEVIVTLRDLEAPLPAIRALLDRAAATDDLDAVVASLEGLLVAISSSNRDRIVELNRLNGRIARIVDHLTRRD